MRTWYVYMVRCLRGALYTGITYDVQARLNRHNSGKGSKAVKALGLPVNLVRVENAGSKSAALKREAEIKKMSKKEKEDLCNPMMSM